MRDQDIKMYRGQLFDKNGVFIGAGAMFGRSFSDPQMIEEGIKETCEILDSLGLEFEVSRDSKIGAFSGFAVTVKGQKTGALQ